MSGKTRKNFLADLGTIWECLRMESDNVTNCWNLVQVDVSDSERGKPFTREQEAEILKAAKTKGHDWYEASMVARHTGLRYSDVARIKTEQVNLDNGEIRLRPNKTKRFAIDLACPINSALMPVMEALVKRGGEYLFPEHAAAYPRFDKVCPFRDVLEAAKVTGEGHTFHSWRHMFRTRLSEAGVSDDLAKSGLGDGPRTRQRPAMTTLSAWRSCGRRWRRRSNQGAKDRLTASAYRKKRTDETGRGLQVIGLKARVSGDAGQHGGTEFNGVVKGEHEVRIANAAQNAVRGATLPLDLPADAQQRVFDAPGFG